MLSISNFFNTDIILVLVGVEVVVVIVQVLVVKMIKHFFNI